MLYSATADPTIKQQRFIWLTLKTHLHIKLVPKLQYLMK